MTHLIWRGQAWRVETRLLNAGSQRHRWGAWPEGYPDYLGMGVGPDQAIADMGDRLDQYERKARNK